MVVRRGKVEAAGVVTRDQAPTGRSRFYWRTNVQTRVARFSYFGVKHDTLLGRLAR